MTIADRPEPLTREEMLESMARTLVYMGITRLDWLEYYMGGMLKREPHLAEYLSSADFPQLWEIVQQVEFERSTSVNLLKRMFGA